MSNINIIQDAIYDTYIKWRNEGETHTVAVDCVEHAFKLLLRGNFRGFTRENSARDNLIMIGAKQVIEELCDCLVSDNTLSDSSYSSNKIQEAFNEGCKQNQGYTRAFDQAKIMVREDPKLIMPAVKRLINTSLLEKMAEKKGMENLKINPANMEALASGIEVKKARTNISLNGNMHAASDIGNFRKNQEDAFLLMVHPDNPDFKIMVVADGMGGFANGEFASDIVVKEARQWFENLDAKYYSQTDKLGGEISKLLKFIDSKIHDQLYGDGGSTIVTAIIGADKTLVTNVGDSRAYAIKGNNLEQVTQDHSMAYDLWKAGYIKQKSDINFFKGSNVITQYLGSNEYSPEINECVVLNNSDYDALCLFTDGVTDCLTDDKLFAVCKKTPSKDLAKAIVDTAKSTDSFVRIGLLHNESYKAKVSGGKDNTTAAVYVNKDKSRGVER